MPRFIGNPEVQRQPSEREWERDRGWVTVDVWAGSEAGIHGIIPDVQADYDKIDISTNDGVIFRLRASINSINDGTTEADDAVNTWELLGAGLTEHITKHAAYDALPTEDKDKLDKFIRDPSITYTSADFTTGEGVSFWIMLQRNQDSYQTSQWILRNTKTVSSRAEIEVSMAGVENVWTTAQLPNDISAGVATAIGEIVTPAVPTEHTWGWLKQTPTITQTVNSKTQVVTEWWLYTWPDIIYPALS